MVTKIFVTESVLKVTKLCEVVLASFDLGKCGLENGV